MIFHKNSRQGKERKQEKKKGLYPVLFVMNTLKDYHTELVQKEVHSLLELGLVGSSFENVLKEAGRFQEKLQDFGQTFSNIDQVSGEFAEVREDRKSVV